MLIKINHFIPSRMALIKKLTITTSIDEDVEKQEPA